MQIWQGIEDLYLLREHLEYTMIHRSLHTNALAARVYGSQ
jgi:hypothetical protein